MFYIWAGVYGFGALIYLTFGTGRLQSWAQSTDKPNVISDSETKLDR